MPDVHRVTRVLDKRQALALKGDDVPEKQPTLSLPGIYVDSDTDEPVFVYLPMPERVSDLRAAVMRMEMLSTRRAKGMTNTSRTFGMAPRRVSLKREACRSTSLSTDQPDEHQVLVDLSLVFTGMMRSLLPDESEHDRDYIEKVLPDWRMAEDALWTSGVVNKSSTLPYHYDGANFPTWSAMPVIRRGMRGGYLDVPEYDIVCSCRDGWVIFFVGNQLLHGVTPMRAVAKDAYRYSVVYYALRGMKNCFEYAVEQKRGRQNRTRREAENMGVPGAPTAVAAHGGRLP
jgi:hypothetical protein